MDAHVGVDLAEEGDGVEGVDVVVAQRLAPPIKRLLDQRQRLARVLHLEMPAGRAQ